MALLEGALAELLAEALRRQPPDWEAELGKLHVGCEQAKCKRDARVADLDRRHYNLLVAVEAGDKTSGLYDRIHELDNERSDVDASPDPALNLPESLPRGFDRRVQKQILRLGKIVQSGELPERDAALRDLAKLTACYVVFVPRKEGLVA